jgi:biopolymer transport protein ExbB/biopolymer transport protein TolQ
MKAYLQELLWTYVRYLLFGAALLPTAVLYALDSPHSQSAIMAVSEIVVGLTFAHTCWLLTSSDYSQRPQWSRPSNVTLAATAFASIAFLFLVLARIAHTFEGSLRAQGPVLLEHLYDEMSLIGKAIAVILLIMSMWSLGVGIERFFTYQQARTQSKLYAPQMAKHLKEGRLKDAVVLSTSKDYRYSHLAKVVLAGLREYEFQKETNGDRLTREELTAAVRNAVQKAEGAARQDLKKRLSSLIAIGSAAPFVGLMGTVVGVITAFQSVGSSGSAGIGAVSIGISEALIETALGLIVAIPAVWAYNYLTARIEYFNVEMDNSSSELVKYLATR